MPFDSTNFWIDDPTIDLEPAGIGAPQACGATPFEPAPKVVIFRPSRSVMQAGKTNAKRWVLEFVSTSKPFIEPLMGWTGSEDPTTHVRLMFATRDHYAVVELHEPKRPNPERIRTTFDVGLHLAFEDDRVMKPVDVDRGAGSGRQVQGAGRRAS